MSSNAERLRWKGVDAGLGSSTSVHMATIHHVCQKPRPTKLRSFPPPLGSLDAFAMSPLPHCLYPPERM